MFVQTGQKENVFKKDPDPNHTFHLDADPDPALHQSYANLRPLVYRPWTAPFLSLNAFNVSANGPPGLHF